MGEGIGGPVDFPGPGGKAWKGAPYDHAIRLEFSAKTWHCRAFVGGVPLYASRMAIECDLEDQSHLTKVTLEVPALNDSDATAVYEGVLVEREEYLRFCDWRTEQALKERR